MRFNIHPRVDRILEHIRKDWMVVDYGCGDGYLKSRHPNTINVDREGKVDAVCDLNLHFPEIEADCAVFSGILEWLLFPDEVLVWALTKYPCVIFSYANTKSDPDWRYLITISDIIAIVVRFRCTLKTVPWQGQTIFIVKKE